MTSQPRHARNRLSGNLWISIAFAVSVVGIFVSTTLWQVVAVEGVAVLLAAAAEMLQRRWPGRWP